MAEIKTQLQRLAEVKSAITISIRRIVRATHATGPLYAALVRAVIQAEKYNLSRVVIAKLIRAELEAEKRRRLVKTSTGKITEVTKVYKGAVARYVMIARWEQGKWAKGEKHVESVELDGHEYKSPVRALETGNFSFRKVFLAWREAVRPPLTDLTAVPTSPQESAERVVKRLALPLLVKENGGEIVRRVKIAESAEALAALLDLLHALPIAKEAERLREIGAREVIRRPVAETRRRRTVAA